MLSRVWGLGLRVQGVGIGGCVFPLFWLMLALGLGFRV